MSLVTTLLPTLIRVAEDGEFNPDTVTPGVLGFLFTAVFALAVIFLGFDLTRRLRRTRVREEVKEKLAAELAERDAAAAPAPAAGSDEDAPRA